MILQNTLLDNIDISTTKMEIGSDMSIYSVFNTVEKEIVEVTLICSVYDNFNCHMSTVDFLDYILKVTNDVWTIS